MQIKYTINYNTPDAYRLQAYTERITEPIQAQVVAIQNTYLTRSKQNRRKIEKAIEIFQDMQTAIHQLVTLMPFGFNRAANATTLKNKCNNIEDIQTIINDNTIDDEEKTKQRKQIMTECQEDQKKKKTEAPTGNNQACSTMRKHKNIKIIATTQLEQVLEKHYL